MGQVRLTELQADSRGQLAVGRSTRSGECGMLVRSVAYQQRGWTVRRAVR